MLFLRCCRTMGPGVIVDLYRRHELIDTDSGIWNCLQGRIELLELNLPSSHDKCNGRQEMPLRI